MKSLRLYLSSILVMFFFSSFNSLHAQKATVELISSISPPTIADTIPIIDGERYVTVYENYLFIVNFWSGVQIIDIHDVNNPAKIGFLRTKDMVYHATAYDNKLFVSNDAEGVIVFDISNIRQPVKIAQIKTPSNAYRTDVNLPYLYVALGSGGFCILDISDLQNPRTLNLEIPDNWVWSVKQRDNKLYVGAKQGGLLIYDISDPENISQLTQYKTGNQVLQFQLEDNLAYIANGPGGLLILDLSAPTLLKKVGEYTTRGFSQHVFKSGNYAYVSNRELGLLIINVADPTHPYLEGQYTPQSDTYCSAKKDVYVFLTTDTETEIMRHNNQPVLKAISDISIDENVPYTLQLEASDPDGDPLIFEAENLPEGTSFDTKTGLFTWRPTYEQSGMYPNVIFRVIEETGSRLSAADTVKITVNHVNRLPDLPTLSNVTLPEDSLLTIQVPEASDPDKEDAGKLQYRVENMPRGAQFDTTTRTFRWKPSFDQSGVYAVDFVVDDGSGGADRESITITVQHVDRPPVIQTIADLTVNEGELLQVQLTGEEPDKEDQNKIRFSMNNLPEGATFNPATAVLSWTPGFDQSGTYSNITAIMTAGNLADTTMFAITVNHVNRPPVLAEIGDQAVDENNLLTFQIKGSDPDKEDVGLIKFSAENLPEGATFDPDSLVFRWTPTFEQAGVYQGITFSVTDPAGLQDQKSITITVNQVDRAPTLLAISPITVNENEVIALQLSASDPDKEDAGKLVYSATSLPQGATLDAKTGSLTWTPGYDQSGSYEITFTVSDGNLFDSKTTTFTVNHVNRPPVLDGIADQTVDENQELTFTVTGQDPDKEDAGKTVFSASNLPEGAKFDPMTHVFRWTPTFEQAGIYSTVLFDLKDPAGLTDEKSVTITVNQVNRQPLLQEVAPLTVDEMQPVSFRLTGSDPDREDAGKLVYAISNLPEGAKLDPATGAFTWTPTYDQAGNYNLSAQVSDPGGLTAATTVNIVVNNVNRPPVIEPLPAVSGKENSEINVTLKFYDPDKEDAGKLIVTATGLPPGASLDAGSGTIRWKPDYQQSGEYSIAYQVKDSFGSTADGSLTIKIENVNRPPELKKVGSKKVKEGETLSFNLNASDPDQEDQGKLSFSAQGIPSGATFDKNNGSFSWTPGDDQQGEYQITFTVTDSGGLSGSTTCKIKVEDVPPPAPPENK